MKHCNKCNTDKPLEEFSKGKSFNDGHNSVCKECFKEYDGTRREAKLHNKRMRAYRAKKRLANAPAPDVDTILHSSAVKAADELLKLNSNTDLNQADISRMKALMDIMLLVRKNARPKKEKKEEKVEPANEDLFE